MSEETQRERYARSALIGLLASPGPGFDTMRDIASMSFAFADAMIEASEAPYCMHCGKEADFTGKTDGGVIVPLCERCRKSQIDT